ncbi:hypothetical protein [Rhodococcus qingshengii]|uniref:hypothetical protein n=1 Tax=Rhodococcus qingshengii TaxID=334542 RepID=UPI0021BA4180|nr:hypothetical protein [Rhodococcus qingshengii]UXF70010.1 hypothetical protein N6G92_13615 [Rhodococcus qingshengii]
MDQRCVHDLCSVQDGGLYDVGATIEVDRQKVSSDTSNHRMGRFTSAERLSFGDECDRVAGLQ